MPTKQRVEHRFRVTISAPHQNSQATEQNSSAKSNISIAKLNLKETSQFFEQVKSKLKIVFNISI